MRRNKVQVQWHKQLKLDELSIEFGFTNRLFRHKLVYQWELMCYDYPERTVQKSWKTYRKTQYRNK